MIEVMWTAVGQGAGQGVPRMGEEFYRRWGAAPEAVAQFETLLRADRIGVTGTWEPQLERLVIYHVAYAGERPTAETLVAWLNDVWGRQFRAQIRTVALSAREL